MAELRKLVETKLSNKQAYDKCLKRATKLGLTISVNLSEQRLKIEKKNHTPGWWIAVIIGFLFYIIPGIVILMSWKQIEYCDLLFEDSDEEEGGTTVIAKVKGETGQEFFSQVMGILT